MRWSEVTVLPSPRTLRQFAVLGLAFTVGNAAWQAIRHGLNPLGSLSLVLAAVLCVLGICKPALAGPVYQAARVLGFPLGWLLSRLSVAFIYYGVLTPLGLLMRWCRRDPLCLRRELGAATYWEKRPQPSEVSRYFRPF